MKKNMRNIFCLCSLFFLFSGIAFGAVVPYPLFSGESASTVYSVQVNGVTVPVHSYNKAHYVHFAFSGIANVVVTVNGGVSAYTLSPVSYSIVSTSSSGTVSFSIKEPRKLILRKVKNSSGANVAPSLVIFAESLEENPISPTGSGVINVSNYGADNTGANDCTTPFTNAVAAVGNNGVLYVPAGTYQFNSGSLNLKSNMTLYLAPGAELRQKSGPGVSYSLVRVSNASNVKIRGRGRINARGGNRTLANWSWYDALDVLTCNNISIEDVLLFDTPGAALWVENTDVIKLFNLKVLSDAAFANTDGMDFSNTRNGDADNIFCFNTDDMNNTGTYSGLPESYNNVWRNIIYNSRIGGAAFAVSGGIAPGVSVRNNRMENVDLIMAPTSARLLCGYTSTGGGDYHDLQFNNFRTEEIGPVVEEQTNGFYCKMSTFGGPLNNIYNISFNHFWIPGSGTQGNQIYGADAQHMVKDVTFNRLFLGGNLVTSFANGGFTGGQAFTQNIQFTNNQINLVNISAVTNTIDPTAEPGRFTLTRSGGSTSSAITVNYTIRGNAIASSDYTTLSGSVVIPSGQSSAEVQVSFLPGMDRTIDKQVILLVKEGNGYFIDKNYIAAVNVPLIGSPATNIAPSGTGTTWTAMTSSTGNNTQSANPIVNDNDLVVDYGLATPSGSRWQAAGVIWTVAKNNITSIKFYNGPFYSNSDPGMCFTANVKAQSSVNGTTWTDIPGWTVSPAYPYNTSASNQIYTFSGNAVSNVKGVRIVGQVRTNVISNRIRVKEVQVFGQHDQGNQQPNLGKKIKIFPNPVYESMTIIYNKDSVAISKIVFRDMSGKQIITTSLPVNNSVNIKYLPRGKYFVIIEDKSKHIIHSSEIIKL
jgi:hypothetical protein